MSIEDQAIQIKREEQIAYQLCFNKDQADGFSVLQDLAKFCRAHESTFNPDPRIHAVLEGRREVWLRIQERLQLTPEQIYALHPIKQIVGRQEHNGISASAMQRGSMNGRT